MSAITVLDTETTGIDPSVDRVVELGWCRVIDGVVGEPDSELVWPDRYIPPEASAIHHLTDADVQFARELSAVLPHALDGAEVAAAHNAKFDQQFVDSGGRPWICTYRCARHVWPDAPAFGNHVLRYWKGLCLRDPRAMPPHRAGPDTFVTAHILAELLKERSVDELIQLTTTPVLLKTVGFGKHFGIPWSQVPKDYLRWLLNQREPDGSPAFDEDTRHTAQFYSGVGR